MAKTAGRPVKPGARDAAGSFPGGADLDRYRNYLRLLARVQLGARPGGRMDPSDLVQQTLLEAYQKREQFRGASDGERAAWLRTILARNVADAMRAQGRLKRDVSRERSLERELAESSARLGDWLAAEGPRPASMPSGTSRPFAWPMRSSACRSTSARRWSSTTGRDARWPRSPPTSSGRPAPWPGCSSGA